MTHWTDPTSKPRFTDAQEAALGALDDARQYLETARVKIESLGDPAELWSDGVDGALKALEDALQAIRVNVRDITGES